MTYTLNHGYKKMPRYKLCMVGNKRYILLKFINAKNKYKVYKL